MYIYIYGIIIIRNEGEHWRFHAEHWVPPLSSQAFHSDHHGVALCWLVECADDWGLIQHSDGFSLPCSTAAVISGHQQRNSLPVLKGFVVNQPVFQFVRETLRSLFRFFMRSIHCHVVTSQSSCINKLSGSPDFSNPNLFIMVLGTLESMGVCLFFKMFRLFMWNIHCHVLTGQSSGINKLSGNPDFSNPNLFSMGFGMPMYPWKHGCFFFCFQNAIPQHKNLKIPYTLSGQINHQRSTPSQITSATKSANYNTWSLCKQFPSTFSYMFFMSCQNRQTHSHSYRLPYTHLAFDHKALRWCLMNKTHVSTTLKAVPRYPKAENP